MRGAGSANYYLNLAQDDYYVSGSEFPGYWLGNGARQLGLGGKVDREAFKNLLEGMSPDGSRPLVQNARQEDRQAAWDLTFSAPKSVSVLWALGPPEIRAEIERMQQRSVRAALSALEKEAGLTRRGKGGAIKERAALSFAVFQHGSSRAQDPQMHSHCVLLNIGVRTDGTTGALMTLEIFRHKMAAGHLYRKRLALELTRAFGVTLEIQKVGFRVVGVPARLCRQFSKRRRAIEKKMQAQGRSGAIEAKLVTLETRPAKIQVPREELLNQWQAVGKSFGWSAEQVEALLHRQPAKARTEPPGEYIDPHASETESNTRSDARDQQDDARPESAMTKEPPDPEPSPVHSDTRTDPRVPAVDLNQAALLPGQSPAASSAPAPQDATEVEPAKGQSVTEESKPNDTSLGGSVDRPVSEALHKQGSGQKLLSVVSQQDGSHQGPQAASVALASKDIATSAPGLITPAVDRPGPESSANLTANEAAPAPEILSTSQPQPSGGLRDRSEDQRPGRERLDPVFEFVKGQATGQQREEAMRSGQSVNSGRHIPTESPPGVQLLPPLASSHEQTSFAEPQRGEKRNANLNGVPGGDKAATPIASREPDAQSAEQPVEAITLIPRDQSSVQKPPDQMLPHDTKSIPPPERFPGQAQKNQEPDSRQEISPNMGAKTKGSLEPDQNTLTSGRGPEELVEQTTPKSRTRDRKEAGQDASRREESNTATGKRATRRQGRRPQDRDRRGEQDSSRTRAESENHKQSQREDRRKTTQGRNKKQASSRYRQNSAEGEPNQKSAAATKGPGMAWRPLFPKAPLWSPASRIRVPWIAYPAAQPRWGNVRWEKKFRFLKISVQDRIMFPDAPKWSRLRGLKHRAVRITIPKEVLPEPPRPRWWSITWKQDLPVGELRIQQRNLFRRAPRWSPLYRMKHKALHVTPKKSKWTQETHQQQQTHMY